MKHHKGFKMVHSCIWSVYNIFFHTISVVVCYTKLEHDWTCSCNKTSPKALRYNAE